MAISKSYDYEIVYTNDRLQREEPLRVLFPEVEKNIVKALHFETVYIVVSDLIGSKENIEFNINIYSSNLKDYLIKSKQYSFQPDVSEESVNFIKQAYLYLKTLPEYVDSVDC